MKSLGDYIHSKGLKYGIYASAAETTCSGKAGTLGNEEIDAQDWADWGVDYLKYDSCYNGEIPGRVRYHTMQQALNKTGRNIFFSIGDGGEADLYEWAPSTGNSWRTTSDISGNWFSVWRNFVYNEIHANLSHPGGWNDPDMLEVGNGWFLTLEMEKSHFALWAIAKAPLILGCDLETVSNSSL